MTTDIQNLLDSLQDLANGDIIHGDKALSISRKEIHSVIVEWVDSGWE